MRLDHALPRLLAPVLLFVAAFCRAADPQPVRIAIVSDTHVNRSQDGDQATYRARFEQVIKDVNAAEVAFVLFTGDLTQGGRAEELVDFKELIKGFRAPVYCVPGNHDIGDKRIADKKPGPSATRLAEYEKQLGPSFYTTERSGFRLIALNSPILGSGLPREAEMWEMLERELGKLSEQPTILFTHYPLFLKTVDEPSSEYWNIEPEPRARLLALLEKAKVQVVLTGHLHRPVTNHLGRMLLFSTLPVSFGLPKGKQPEGWALLTFRGPGEPTVEMRSVSVP